MVYNKKTYLIISVISNGPVPPCSRHLSWDSIIYHSGLKSCLIAGQQMKWPLLVVAYESTTQTIKHPACFNKSTLSNEGYSQSGLMTSYL